MAVKSQLLKFLIPTDDSRDKTSQQRSTNKHWRREINKIPDRPRKEAVSQFRLTTGHDCLVQHLHRFKMVPLPFCTLCNLHEEMDRARLQKCPALPNGVNVIATGNRGDY